MWMRFARTAKRTSYADHNQLDGRDMMCSLRSDARSLLRGCAARVGMAMVKLFLGADVDTVLFVRSVVHF